MSTKDSTAFNKLHKLYTLLAQGKSITHGDFQAYVDGMSLPKGASEDDKIKASEVVMSVFDRHMPADSNRYYAAFGLFERGLYGYTDRSLLDFTCEMFGYLRSKDMPKEALKLLNKVEKAPDDFSMYTSDLLIMYTSDVRRSVVEQAIESIGCVSKSSDRLHYAEAFLRDIPRWQEPLAEQAVDAFIEAMPANNPNFAWRKGLECLALVPKSRRDTFENALLVVLGNTSARLRAGKIRDAVKTYNYKTFEVKLYDYMRSAFVKAPEIPSVPLEPAPPKRRHMKMRRAFRHRL